MDWKEVKRDLLKDPAVRREWEASEPEYQLARAIIRQRLAKGLVSAPNSPTRVGTKQPVISRLGERREQTYVVATSSASPPPSTPGVVVTLEGEGRRPGRATARRRAS